MNLIKKILFPIFSIFLAYRSIDLMKSLIHSDVAGYSNFEQIVISFLLNLFITGIFAFTGFAYKTSRILPENYFKIKNPKLLNFIYRIFGIEYFRFILILAFWGRKNNREKYFDGTKRGLQNFIFQTKQSEFGHLGAFIAILISSIVLLFKGYYFLVIIASVFNIAGNFLPVILQRKHRMRIEKVTSLYSVRNNPKV